MWGIDMSKGDFYRSHSLNWWLYNTDTSNESSKKVFSIKNKVFPFVNLLTSEIQFSLNLIRKRWPFHPESLLKHKPNYQITCNPCPWSPEPFVFGRCHLLLEQDAKDNPSKGHNKDAEGICKLCFSRQWVVPTTPQQRTRKRPANQANNPAAKGKRQEGNDSVT